MSAIERVSIRLEQPLGAFYAFSLSAATLDKITYSQPAEVIQRLEHEDQERVGGYSIFGTQRKQRPTRLEEIASFIQTTEATFPNAIILAANYDEQGRYIENESHRWSVRPANVNCPNENAWLLRIPSLEQRTASIIDGQHRLRAFRKLPVDAPEWNMEMLCVVFLELPPPYHAFVFATINFNQKKVDRSLAYELFGFDVDERPPKYWPPETLAVYLARSLNTDNESPLYKSISPAADSDALFPDKTTPVASVRVSLATVVDGILRLISREPKEDRNTLRRRENLDRGREVLESIRGLPLRDLYLSYNDKAIYELLTNYFKAVEETIWGGAGDGSYLRKTVGVQALFDVLRMILAKRVVNATNYSVSSLSALLEPASALDPNGNKYQASGIGRSQMRQELLSAIGVDHV
jgi:DNA phosphorothioation-associated DGQHR protein 1